MVNSKIDESIRAKEQAREEIAVLEAKIISCEKYLEENTVIPIESLKEKLSESQEINEQIRARDRNRIADRKENKAKNEYNDLTQDINDEIKKMENGLKENWHKIPDQKLSLTETEIAYDGTPYSNSLLRTIKGCHKDSNGFKSKIESYQNSGLFFIRQ